MTRGMIGPPAWRAPSCRAVFKAYRLGPNCSTTPQTHTCEQTDTKNAEFWFQNAQLGHGSRWPEPAETMRRSTLACRAWAEQQTARPAKRASRLGRRCWPKVHGQPAREISARPDWASTPTCPRARWTRGSQWCALTSPRPVAHALAASCLDPIGKRASPAGRFNARPMHGWHATAQQGAALRRCLELRPRPREAKPQLKTPAQVPPKHEA